MAQSYSRKRQFPRRAFNRRVALLHKGDFSIFEAGSIGEGGLSLLIPNDHIKVEDHVILTFQIPDGKMIAVRAEVRSAVKGLLGKLVYGFKFEDLPFIEKRKIRTFVSARTDLEDDTNQ